MVQPEIHPTKNILFASDLSTNMKDVFKHAATLAACQNANIIVLHVMEETDRSKKRIKMAFGEQLYNGLKAEQKDGARNILIGKNVDALKIRQAISGFFGKHSSIVSDDESIIKKILVVEGRSITNEILSTAVEEECDMIVIGCKQQGLLADAMSDHVVRKVLRRSSVPVLVIPVPEN